MSHKIESLVPCIIIVIISLKSRCTSEHARNITTLETMTKTLTCKAGCFHLAALKLNVPSHVRILRQVRKAFARKTGEMAALS